MNAVIRDVKDAYSQSSSQLQSKLESLLDSIVSKITANTLIWRIYSDFWFWKGDFEKVSIGLTQCLSGYIRSFRICSSHPYAYTVEEPFEVCVSCLKELIDAYRNFGEKKKCNSNEVVQPDWQYQAMLTTRNLIKRSSETFEGTPMHNELVDLLKRMSE